MLEERILTFDGNINHRLSYFKYIFSAQHEVEVVIEDWLRRFYNNWLREEFQWQRGASYYEHKGLDYDYANGYYHRRLLTSRGSLILKVPRGRKERYKYLFFEKYKRYSRQFEDMVVESLLLGHSTRDAKRFFNKVFGPGTISHTLASRIIRRFDHEITIWKKHPINKPVAVLVLDAIHLRGAITGLKRAKPVLFAYCVYEDGTEELVDFEPASYESSESYSSFCGRLYARGLRQVDLVVRDDHKGLKEAIATYWPQAKQQFCVFHLMQNFIKLLKGIDKKRKQQIIKAVSYIYESKDKTAFYGALKKLISAYRQMKHHPAFKYLYTHLEDTTQFYEINEAFWAAAKTTNRLERIFKEIKRRVKAFGRFPNTRSCERWLYALIKEGLIPKYRRIRLSSQIKSTQFS
jgi:transposase-like protein